MRKLGRIPQIDCLPHSLGLKFGLIFGRLLLGRADFGKPMNTIPMKQQKKERMKENRGRYIRNRKKRILIAQQVPQLNWGDKCIESS